jgi:uncharacterized protein (UPF0548 family)
MFRVGWATVAPRRPPLEVGREVAVVIGRLGLWTLNAARIVYVVDEDDGRVARRGFAYGTLPDHVERGEERFLVEWDRESDRVSYEIRAFSWPNHWITYCGFPVVRRFQAQFRRASIRAMQRAVRAKRSRTRSWRAAGFTPAGPGDLARPVMPTQTRVAAMHPTPVPAGPPA